MSTMHVTSWLNSLRRGFLTTPASRVRRPRSPHRGQPGFVQVQSLETRVLLSGSTGTPELTTVEEVSPGVVMVRSFTMLDEAHLVSSQEIVDPSSELNGNGLQFNLIPAGGMSQQAIDGFQAAADLWSAILTDDIIVNININFTALGAGILGSANSTKTNVSYTDYRNSLIADATSLDDATAVAALDPSSAPGMLINRTANSPHGAGSATPYLDNDGDANNSTVWLNTTVAKAVGLLPANNAAVDASISFSTSFTWDFDRSNGISGGAFDFVGVAAHEIGHALGFVSGVDILDANSPPNNGPFNDHQFTFVSALDLFRYSNDSFAQGVHDWTADNRTKYFSIDGGATSLTTFSTGRTFGDGQQASHWKDNLGIGAMDPTAASGEFVDVTNMDVRAFDVIGWDVAMDYGDAPDTGLGTGPGNYQTTLSNDGPRHYLFSASGLISDPNGAPKVFLGSGVTRDFDGQPNGTATGDTDDGIASFPTLTIGSTVNFDVTSTANGAILDYFFDFNADGDFLDPGEAFSVVLNSATQSVPVTIPVSAVAGQTVARFRISTAGGLGPTGAAADGEVEDYLVTLSQATGGFTITETGLGTSVSEHGSVAQKTDTFNVVLDVAPASNVVLNVVSSDPTAATVNVAALTFTPGNWNVAQTVTVSGVFDNVTTPDRELVIWVSVDAGLSDDAYDAVPTQAVNVTVLNVANRPVVLGPTGTGNPALPTFTWEDVAGETAYALWLINKTTGALVFQRSDIAADSTSYTLTETDVPGGLAAGGQYRFWINSISANGYSQSGAPTDFTVGAALTPPAAPTGFDADFTGNPLRPQINWGSVPTATSYSIYLIRLADSAVIANASGLTNPNFTPGVDLANGRHRIWVKAHNTAGSSAWSAPFDFTVGPVLTPPAAPTGFSLTNGETTTPTINWGAVPTAATYSIYFIRLADGALISGATGLTDPNFTPGAPLSPGTHRIWVKAHNAAGSSSWSTPYDFTIGTPIVPPTAPTGFSVLNANTANPTVTWESQGAGVTYSIWFINLDTGAVVSGATGLTTNSFTASGLTTNRYRIWVKAHNSAGSSSWSSPFDFDVTVA
jgi:hypothetical protein